MRLYRLVHGDHFYRRGLSAPPGYDTEREHLSLDVPYLWLRGSTCSRQPSATGQARMVPWSDLYEPDLLHGISHGQAVDQQTTLSLGLRPQPLACEQSHQA